MIVHYLLTFSIYSFCHCMDNAEKPLTMEIEPAVSQFRQRRIALHQYRRQITALLREIVQSLRSLNTAIQTQKIQTSPAANRNDGSPKTGVAVERFDSYCELTKGNIRIDHEIISWLLKRNIIISILRQIMYHWFWNTLTVIWNKQQTAINTLRWEYQTMIEWETTLHSFANMKYLTIRA